VANPFNYKKKKKKKKKGLPCQQELGDVLANSVSIVIDAGREKFKQWLLDFAHRRSSQDLGKFAQSHEEKLHKEKEKKRILFFLVLKIIHHNTSRRPRYQRQLG